jgi:hypothetical protein
MTMLVPRCFGCLQSFTEEEGGIYECPSCHQNYCIACLNDGCPKHLRGGSD